MDCDKTVMIEFGPAVVPTFCSSSSPLVDYGVILQ